VEVEEEVLLEELEWRRWSWCKGNGQGTAGTANTGGGGGGGYASGASQDGSAGGKGVVILSMPLAKFSNTTTGSPTESDDGTTKVLIFKVQGVTQHNG
jgi:hypothetical protein